MKIPTPTIRILPKHDEAFYDDLHQLFKYMSFKYYYECEEWYWCEGDVSINIVDRTPEGDVFIYINEVLVGRFGVPSFLDQTGFLYSGHDSNDLNCDVLAAMVEFIDKWGIGV